MKKILLFSFFSLSFSFCLAQDIKFSMEQQDVEGVRCVSTTGAIGKSIRFDGYSNYVSENVDLSKISSEAMTFTLWCAAETYPMMNIDKDENTYSDIAGTLDPDSKTGFAFSLSNRGNWKFSCFAGGGNAFELAATELLPKRRWNFLAATVDVPNRQLTLYLNGEKVSSTTLRAGLTFGNSPMLIGKSKSDVKFEDYLLSTFNGIIDEVYVYNKVLSAEEIKRLANGADVACGSIADVSTPREAFAEDIFRPQFHGMPSAGWTNECHGLIFSGGKYHVFFQKNGNGPYMSRLHWGHITSENLYNWKEEPIAIDPSESYDVKGCWSGCLVDDAKLFGETPAIIYTGVDYAKASINFATSKAADLLDWEKAGKNPQIAQRPSGLSDDFRDPYFFRTDNGAYIIVGSSKNNVGCCTLHKYNEGNRTWTNDGTLFFQGTNASTCGTFWEMPNIISMGNGLWLFTVTPQNTGSGVRTLYWVGTIDAKGQFNPIEGTWPQTVEVGRISKDGYGLLSPSVYQKDGKTFAMGIVPDKVTSANNYKWGWAHCYCLPREWSLDNDGTLIQKPLGVLSNMRIEETAFSKRDFNLNGEETLSNIEGRQIEVCATFEVGAFDFGIDLFSNGNNKKCRIKYSPSTYALSVDFSSLDRIINDGSNYKGVYSTGLPAEHRPAQGETMKLQVFLDGSILDIFINDRYATSIRLFISGNEATQSYLFADGNTTIKEVGAWQLDYKKDSPSGIENIWSDFLEPNQLDNTPKARYEINQDTHQIELYSIEANGKKTRVM